MLKTTKLGVGLAILGLGVLAGACPHEPSYVDGSKCKPAHLDKPNKPAGQLCRFNIQTEECEEVNCTGTFTEIAATGFCAGATPASGKIGCTDNYGSVDLWKKVYSAYCTGDPCGCWLRQQTDPVTGQPMTTITTDVCDCRDV